MPTLPVRFGQGPRLLIAGFLLAGAAGGAPAQAARTLPETVEVGRLQIGVFPQATLDGQPVQLGAGARIRDEQNLIRPPSTIAGPRPVAFVRGAMNEITQVWLLSDAEFGEVSRRIAEARRAGAPR